MRYPTFRTRGVLVPEGAEPWGIYRMLDQEVIQHLEEVESRVHSIVRRYLTEKVPGGRLLRIEATYVLK